MRARCGNRSSDASQGYRVLLYNGFASGTETNKVMQEPARCPQGPPELASAPWFTLGPLSRLSDICATRSLHEQLFTARRTCDSAPGCTLQLEHPCGAQHAHLASDDTIVPCRSLPHLPEDDTGLPHILEHTSLCGSNRFPFVIPFS